MLRKLIIRNFVLIDELVIDFDKGFSVITGETGAGKSILLGAIALLMGQRADASSIRTGADRCIIEAHFTDVDEVVDRILESEEIEVDSQECIIRREISAKGKSRSFVNDTPASLSLLKRLNEYFIDIHSQHKNLLLGDAEFQLSVVDLYSQNQDTRAAYTELWQRYRAVEAELKQLRDLQAQNLKEQDYLSYQLEQLEEANLQAGELERIEREEVELRHMQDIKQALYRSYEALENDEYSALGSVSSALDSLNHILEYYAPATDLYERLQSVRIELKDLARHLERDAEHLDLDPERQAILVERIDLLNSLLNKHRKDCVEELIEERDSIAQKLRDITGSDARIQELEITLERLEAELLQVAEQLHVQRALSARAIEEALVPTLHELGMPYVQLILQVKALEKPTATGRDAVTIYFSANKEIAPEPVAEIASGGEISRLMLAIKALIADKRSLPTIIFDEIDTGVSGETAERVGRILQNMGRSMQVMAVTHLPQIAASGRRHYYIYKEHDSDVTRSHIVSLDEQGRLEEIARMQSGNNINKITLAAAKELLNKSQARLKK